MAVSPKKTQKFRGCFECGGKCCKFFGAPMEYRDVLYTSGVPIDIYRDRLERNPKRYFEMRIGLTISPDGERFIVDRSVPVRIIATRFGAELVVYSICSKLDIQGRCSIYQNRPDMCRNFTDKTVDDYLVPRGCMYDNKDSGEDFGV